MMLVSAVRMRQNCMTAWLGTVQLGLLPSLGPKSQIWWSMEEGERARDVIHLEAATLTFLGLLLISLVWDKSPNQLNLRQHTHGVMDVRSRRKL